MRTYAIHIKPLSPFGTSLKGDTIFGQFCCMAAESPDTITNGLDHWITRYHERPFVVFSSAWPMLTENGKATYVLRRPELPLSILGDPEKNADCRTRMENRKKNKSRKWLVVEDDLRIQLKWGNLIDDKSVYLRTLATLPEDERKRLRMVSVRRQRPVSSAEQQHNTINRLTMTTGKGEFAPYSTDNIHFMPGLALVIFAGVDDEACSRDQLREIFTRMGHWGFGRDASTGLGRFSLTGLEEVTLPAADTKEDACLALSPFVPENDSYSSLYFQPFTRFGRHGSQLLHTRRPFKNPVVMADEGAVLVPQTGKFPEKPYIGRTVRNVSKAQPEALVQGYTLYLPMKLPALSEGGNHA